MRLTMKYLIHAICTLISLLSIAQELPPIVSFPPEIYKADNQNWSIDQTEDKLIYVANNMGTFRM